jgi:hypothetical protein
MIRSPWPRFEASRPWHLLRRRRCFDVWIHQAGKLNRVPVLIGTNRDEGSLFTKQFFDYTPQQMVFVRSEFYFPAL